MSIHESGAGLKATKGSFSTIPALRFCTSFLTLVLMSQEWKYHISNPRIRRSGQSIVPATMEMCSTASTSGEMQKSLRIFSMISWNQQKKMTLHLTMMLICLTMSWITIGWGELHGVAKAEGCRKVEANNNQYAGWRVQLDPGLVELGRWCVGRDRAPIGHQRKENTKFGCTRV